MQILRSKGQLLRYLWDHTSSNKHLKRHILTYLWNAWIYLTETYQNYSLPGSYDIDDIFKIMGSKVNVTDSFEKCTFYRAAACNATHGIAMRILSICLSNTWFVTEWKLCSHDKKNGWWGRPLLSEILGQTDSVGIWWPWLPVPYIAYRNVAAALVSALKHYLHFTLVTLTVH